MGLSDIQLGIVGASFTCMAPVAIAAASQRYGMSACLSANAAVSASVCFYAPASPGTRVTLNT
jgi:hypothetical protein